MPHGASFTRLVAGLPASVPFVAPEAIERQTGRPIRLRLGANESPFGPSSLAREAMRAAAGRVEWYGDPESYDLRRALAARHGVGIEHIVVGSGIDDLLGLIVRTYLDQGGIAVTSLGAYPTFNYHVTGYGARLVTVPYRDDRNDLWGLAEAAQTSGARLVYLVNPDNPTGSWYSADEIARFIAALPEHASLVLDEAYCDFAPEEAIPPFDPDDPRILRVRTFSKAHGLAGARIGYAVATASAIAAFEKVRLHFGVNLVAQEGALASINDPDYLRQVVRWTEEGRAEYTALAHELGMRPLPSAANFVALDTGSRERAQALVDALAERDVFVRMPGAPPLNQFIRVTVGLPEQRAALANILREVWPRVVARVP